MWQRVLHAAGGHAHAHTTDETQNQHPHSQTHTQIPTPLVSIKQQDVLYAHDGWPLSVTTYYPIQIYNTYFHHQDNDNRYPYVCV